MDWPIISLELVAEKLGRGRIPARDRSFKRLAYDPVEGRVDD